MEEFIDELLKLFRVGCADHSKKMNPAKMREHLVNTFPHKFSIPSEMEIKKFINSKSQKLKNIKAGLAIIPMKEEVGNKKVPNLFG